MATALDPNATAANTAPAAPEAPDYKDKARKWLGLLNVQTRALDDWEKRGDRITKRYRQTGSTQEPVGAGAKFNIFWSNVDTLAPATYSRRPQVEVYRRFHDQDPIGRLAATILQRAIQYEIDCGLELHQTMKAVVKDRLLPGRGVAWVRYEAEFTEREVDVPVEGSLETTKETVEDVTDERSCVDYVYWKDFRHAPGRTWADVSWVARRVFFDKDKLKARFGKSIARFGGKIEDVPCNYDPVSQASEETPNTMRGGQEIPAELKRAAIWEIWDKESREAIWVCAGVEVPLDIVEDPLELRGFLPTPEPLFATMTNDELVPVADFIIYRDQIRELDTLTNRITLLQGALRVVGVYDASQASLQTLLASGMENRMIPVNAWAAFAEKGGLKGVTDFLPMEQVVKVLEGLYTAREQTKQTIYEITGMADIIRGASKASETFGAQQIKSKFANLRLSSRQQQAAEFMTALLQMKAEIICNLYSPETIQRIASADQISDAIAHPERVQQAIALLKDKKLLHYRVEVAESSMLEPDEAEERERRNDFMSTVSNFMNAIKNVAAIAPEMFPVALEMLRFTVRGFAVARSLEVAIEDASQAIQKRLAAPQEKEPSEAQVKMALEKMKQDGELLRLRIKEDAATDREELKAMVELTIQNLEARLMTVVSGAQALDQVSDADQAQDMARLAPQPATPQQPPQGM